MRLLGMNTGHGKNARLLAKQHLTVHGINCHFPCEAKHHHRHERIPLKRSKDDFLCPYAVSCVCVAWSGSAWNRTGHDQATQAQLAVQAHKITLGAIHFISSQFFLLQHSMYCGLIHISPVTLPGNHTRRLNHAYVYMSTHKMPEKDRVQAEA